MLMAQPSKTWKHPQRVDKIHRWQYPLRTLQGYKEKGSQRLLSPTRYHKALSPLSPSLSQAPHQIFLFQILLHQLVRCRLPRSWYPHTRSRCHLLPQQDLVTPRLSLRLSHGLPLGQHPLTSIPPITPSFPFPGPLPRPEPILPIPTFVPPPGFPPIAPHHVPMARPLAAGGFPYYPPLPVAALVDPIAVAAAVGQAMAEQMAPQARDANRNDLGEP